jgi:hypothetical protein
MPNELVEHLRGQQSNDVCGQWRVQEARQPMFGRAPLGTRRIAVRDLGHRRAMIRVLALNKQS